MITQSTKSKSLFELFKERVIVFCGDYFCYIHICSAKLLICSQTFVNLKYIQKLEISYEFDGLIFTPMYRGRICHVLLTVQNTHRRPLLFNDNRHFYWLFTQTKIGSIYRNKAIVTYTCIGPWWNVKCCLQFRRNTNLQWFFFAFLSGDPLNRVARGGKLWSLDAEYIQLL